MSRATPLIDENDTKNLNNEGSKNVRYILAVGLSGSHGLRRASEVVREKDHEQLIADSCRVYSAATESWTTWGEEKKRRMAATASEQLLNPEVAKF